MYIYINFKNNIMAFIKESQMGIYSIKYDQDSRIYIGSTKNFVSRKSKHLFNLRNGNHPNQNLQKLYDCFDEVGFNFTVLERIPIEKTHLLLNIERDYLNKYFAEEYMNSKGKDDRFVKLTLNKIPGAGTFNFISDEKREEIKRKNIERWKDPKMREAASIRRKEQVAKLKLEQPEEWNAMMLRKDALQSEYWDIERKNKARDCPYCHSIHVRALGLRENKTAQTLRQRYKCQSCNKGFSKTVGPLKSDL